MPDTNSQSWVRLDELANTGDSEALERYVESLGPSEAFRALSRLDSAQRERVLTTLSPGEAASFIAEIPAPHHVAELIEQLPTRDAASILSELKSDVQADVLGDLDKSDAEEILAKMAPEVAANARQLAVYDDNVAGGLMTTELLSFTEDVRVGEVVGELEARAEGETDEVYIYVVSPFNRLVGALDFRDLVLSRHSTPLTEVLTTPVFVVATTSLDALDSFFQRHNLFAVPVVDERQRLIGVVHRKTVRKALAERAEQDYLKTQGIVGGDEIRTMSTLTRSRRRLSWLSINIVLNIIAASVIAFYQDTLSAVIALAVFLPIVSDMSGCSGNQAVAVSMRELSLGLVKPADVLRVWTQEARVGLINGLVLGALIAVVAFLWRGNPWLGLVVGAALATNTLIAVSIGGTIPLLLKRLNIDPAVASGPILTTVTDMCGFFLVLSFATLMLPLLSNP